MAKWIDVEQNNDDWYALRAGRIGGSSIGYIMANYGKAFGDPAHKLAVKLAIEQITGRPQESGFSNAHMERGHEQEPIARALYEDETFCDVLNGGYYIEGDDIGVSPDGLVGLVGLIEIKSVIASEQYKTVKRSKYDPKYKWQLAFNLKVSQRVWIDYVSFCADFPEGKRLFVHRQTRNDFHAEFSMINDRLAEFRRLVEEKKATISQIGRAV